MTCIAATPIEEYLLPDSPYVFNEKYKIGKKSVQQQLRIEGQFGFRTF